MLRGSVIWAGLCLSCCILLGARGPVEAAGSGLAAEDPDMDDWEWGSGSHLLQELLHSFPADSPFVTETPGRPANCTERFWLPPTSPVCWDDIAGPEELEKSRLLILQNRAALQAVATSYGVDEGGLSYEQQTRDEVEGVRTDHQNVTETIGTMQKVFLSLEEKRKEGAEFSVFSSIKQKMAGTKDAIDGRDVTASFLEQQFSRLETSLLIMQHRLNTLMAH